MRGDPGAVPGPEAVTVPLKPPAETSQHCCQRTLLHQLESRETTAAGEVVSQLELEQAG